jgi:anti-sigma regulatory factor (Ser/Thr protein kinase)
MSQTVWARRRPPDPDRDLFVVMDGSPQRPADVTALRRRLRAAVGGAASGGTDEDVERLLLAFEELTSNGLRHGRPPVQVLVTATARGWLIDVSDAAGSRPPAPAIGRDAAQGGLGLHLVARISRAHGWTLDGEGRKHVWARIDQTLAEAPSAAGPSLPRPRSGQPGPDRR